MERFSSYYHQLAEIFAVKPASVLEVGVGDKVVGHYLKEVSDIAYTSIDVAEDLHPDIVGSVLALPFPDSSYDLVCAFEVLEHIEFSSFEKALSEMLRVSRGPVLISVPHFGPQVRVSLKIPFFPELRLAWKIPYPRKHVWNGQHHWEVGKRGYPVSLIRNVIRRQGNLARDFIPFETPYHHFFVITK